MTDAAQNKNLAPSVTILAPSPTCHQVSESEIEVTGKYTDLDEVWVRISDAPITDANPDAASDTSATPNGGIWNAGSIQVEKTGSQTECNNSESAAKNHVRAWGLRDPEGENPVTVIDDSEFWAHS